MGTGEGWGALRGLFKKEVSWGGGLRSVQWERGGWGVFSGEGGLGLVLWGAQEDCETGLGGPPRRGF